MLWAHSVHLEAIKCLATDVNCEYMNWSSAHWIWLILNFCQYFCIGRLPKWIHYISNLLPFVCLQRRKRLEGILRSQDHHNEDGCQNLLRQPHFQKELSSSSPLTPPLGGSSMMTNRNNSKKKKLSPPWLGCDHSLPSQLPINFVLSQWTASQSLSSYLHSPWVCGLSLFLPATTELPSYCIAPPLNTLMHSEMTGEVQ